MTTQEKKIRVNQLQNEINDMVRTIDKSVGIQKMRLYANFDLEMFEKKKEELISITKNITLTNVERKNFEKFIKCVEKVIDAINIEKQAIVEATSKMYGVPFSKVTYIGYD